MELLQVFREITMLKNRSSMHSSLKLTHTSPTVTASRCLSLRSELTCTKFGASGGRKTVKHLTACEKCGLAFPNFSNHPQPTGARRGGHQLCPPARRSLR